MKIIKFLFQPWFRKLVEIEEGLTSINAVKGPRIFSTMPTRRLGIEDDHIPFLRRSKQNHTKIELYTVFPRIVSAETILF